MQDRKERWIWNKIPQARTYRQIISLLHSNETERDFTQTLCSQALVSKTCSRHAWSCI